MIRNDVSGSVKKNKVKRPVTRVSKRRLGGTLTGAHSIFMLYGGVEQGDLS